MKQLLRKMKGGAAFIGGENGRSKSRISFAKGFGELRGGFTLIEMIIVIAIIGILATIVIRSFVFIASARDSKRISDIRTVQNYLEMYYNAEGQYPPDSGWTKLTSDLQGAIPNVTVPKEINGIPYCYNPLAGPTNGTDLSYVIGTELETNSNVVNNSVGEAKPKVTCAMDSGTLTCGAGTPNVYCVEPQ